MIKTGRVNRRTYFLGVTASIAVDVLLARALPEVVWVDWFVYVWLGLFTVVDFFLTLWRMYDLGYQQRTTLVVAAVFAVCNYLGFDFITGPARYVVGTVLFGFALYLLFAPGEHKDNEFGHKPLPRIRFPFQK